MHKKHKIIVAITGASGSIYAKVLLDKLSELSSQIDQVGVVMSDNAKDVWKLELGNEDYKRHVLRPFAGAFARSSSIFLARMLLWPVSVLRRTVT